MAGVYGGVTSAKDAQGALLMSLGEVDINHVFW